MKYITKHEVGPLSLPCNRVRFIKLLFAVFDKEEILQQEHMFVSEHELEM